MESYPKQKSAIEQAMDVCRPAQFDPEGDDWRQAEVAALAAEIELDPRLVERRSRIAAIDSNIAAAVGQAFVPEGLAERLLARLQAAAQADQAAQLGPSVVLGSAQPVEQVISLSANRPDKWRPRMPRRRWLAGAAALAACLAGVWVLRPLDPLSYEQILEAAIQDVDSMQGGWSELAKGRPLKGYPFSSAIAARLLRWREARAFLGRGAVAYDVASRTGAKATLYVVPLNRVAGLDFEAPYDSLPRRPLMTGGQATAAWTDGKTLWVLVVQGGHRDYLSFAPHDVV